MTSVPVIPDWSYEVAKARHRIVAEWRAFTALDTWHGEKKALANAAFLVALRAGQAVPQAVLDAAGTISLATIYRWDKTLREHGDDLEALADRRGGWTQGKKGHGQIGEEAEKILLAAWLTPNRPSAALAYEMTKAMLERAGKPAPSYASVLRFLRRFDAERHDLVVLKREGEKSLRDKVGPYIARKADILDVGDVLFADGHTLNFDSHHPVTGKPCRLTLIVWYDWRSRMPVGWEIMPTETTLAIASALHMGIRNLGKYPRAAYIDNGKAFKAKYFSESSDLHELDGLYLRLGIAVQHSKPYAAQTKIVERFWGSFNEQCARLLPSYRGNSVDDKPAYLKRAEGYHKTRHNEFIPTIQQTADIFAAYVNWYAHRPHDGLGGHTPWSVFAPGRGQGVDAGELDRHFLLRKKVAPQRTGFVIAGVRYESDALYGLHKPVLACYSWADMREVALYDCESGARLGTAKPVEALHPLARVFGDELDLLKVAEANKRQQALRRSTLALAKEIDGHADALQALPWMRPAAERRTAVAPPNASKPEALPEFSAAQLAEFESLTARLEAEQAAAPPYELPFFGSEADKYEHLFQLCHFDRVDLLPAHRAFMEDFEGRPEFASRRRRYEQLRETLKFMEATA